MRVAPTLDQVRALATVSRQWRRVLLDAPHCGRFDVLALPVFEFQARTTLPTPAIMANWAEAMNPPRAEATVFIDRRLLTAQQQQHHQQQRRLAPRRLYDVIYGYVACANVPGCHPGAISRLPVNAAGNNNADDGDDDGLRVMVTNQVDGQPMGPFCIVGRTEADKWCGLADLAQAHPTLLLLPPRLSPMSLVRVLQWPQDLVVHRFFAHASLHTGRLEALMPTLAADARQLLFRLLVRGQSSATAAIAPQRPASLRVWIHDVEAAIDAGRATHDYCVLARVPGTLRVWFEQSARVLAYLEPESVPRSHITAHGGLVRVPSKAALVDAVFDMLARDPPGTPPTLLVADADVLEMCMKRASAVGIVAHAVYTPSLQHVNAIPAEVRLVIGLGSDYQRRRLRFLGHSPELQWHRVVTTNCILTTDYYFDTPETSLMGQLPRNSRYHWHLSAQSSWAFLAPHVRSLMSLLTRYPAPANAREFGSHQGHLTFLRHYYASTMAI